MFGHDGWRPLTVAMLVSVATFLPQGVASAAPPRPGDPASSFVGPVGAADGRRGGSVAGIRLTGSASVELATVTTPSGGRRNPAVLAAPAPPTVPAVPGATVTVGPVTPEPAALQAAPAATLPATPVAATSVPTAAAATGSASSGSSDSSDSSGSSDSGDDSSGGSGTSGSDDDSSGSTTSGSTAGGSTSAGTSGATAGSGSCPTGAPATSTPTAATGSVAAGASPSSADGGGTPSSTDVSRGVDGPLGALGTATQATVQGLAALPGAASSVAGATGGAGATTSGGTARATGSANLPGDLIDLTKWYLTLPTGKPGSPDTVENPALASFTNEFFKLTAARDGVVFSANGDGVTTKNSKYPRSELREMNGGEKASWTNTSGTHTITVCEAFTKLPATKPEVVGVQIHDGSDDVMQIRLEGQKLMVQYDDGKSEALLDPAYKLGTPFTVQIVAANSKVDVAYNGQQKASLPLSGSGWYWKVGAYVQSNKSKGDSGPTSTGEVTVYGIDMTHA